MWELCQTCHLLLNSPGSPILGAYTRLDTSLPRYPTPLTLSDLIVLLGLFRKPNMEEKDK